MFIQKTQTNPPVFWSDRYFQKVLSFEKNNLVEKVRVPRESKSKKNKELGVINRIGNSKCVGKRNLT